MGSGGDRGLSASIITIRGGKKNQKKPPGHRKKGPSCGFVSSRVIPAAEQVIETSAAEMECCSLTGDL